jgi:hypothetical protein
VRGTFIPLEYLFNKLQMPLFLLSLSLVAL